MLADLDRTLEKLLRDYGGISESVADIAFDQPTGEWSASLTRPALNLWCFDIRENLKLRNMSLNAIPTKNGTFRSVVPPRRLDCTYLVTAWSGGTGNEAVFDEHRLLWRALTVFKHFPILKPENCLGDLQNAQHDIPLLAADMSEMHFNTVDLWSVLENQMRVGFIAVATLELDTQEGIESQPFKEFVLRFTQRPLEQTTPTPMDRRARFNTPVSGGNMGDVPTGELPKFTIKNAAVVPSATDDPAAQASDDHQDGKETPPTERKRPRTK